MRKEHREEETAEVSIEYYQQIFFFYTEESRNEIEEVLLKKPRRNRINFWKQFIHLDNATNDQAWDALSNYSLYVEKQLKVILNKHSVFYWLHMYRRIGVGLHEAHDGKTDAHTTYLVRHILEAAIAKFGDLGKEDDIQLSDNVSQDEILGGYLSRFLLNEEEIIQKYFNLLLSQKQWVLVDWKPLDLIDIYECEGLAYEYWKLSAAMRSVGKGAVLRVNESKGFYVNASNTLTELLASYDKRVFKYGSASSNKGLTYFSENEDKRSYVLAAHYNVTRVAFSEVFPQFNSLNKTALSNFMFYPIDLNSYILNHSFMSNEFEEKHKVSFKAICSAISSLSFKSVSITMNQDLSDIAFSGVWRLMQRGYITTADDESKLVADSHKLIEYLNLEGSFDGLTEEESKYAFEFLSLTTSKQKNISLWTYGPRYPIITHAGNFIIDIAAFPLLIQNLFFGLRENQTTRGDFFENNFRLLLDKNYFKLLPDRLLNTNHNEKRETDAAVRIGSTLVLIDCRSIEKPLDFEIGRPKTLMERQRRLEEKIAKVKSIKEFVIKNKTGKNYDFSWAKQIISIGVSPFVEWMWTNNIHYWVDELSKYPIIMSPKELIEYLETIRISSAGKRGTKKRRN